MALCGCSKTISSMHITRNRANQTLQGRPVATAATNQRCKADHSPRRCQAVPAADVAADMSLVAEGLGVLGFAAGGVFGALFNLEKQNNAKLQQELQEVQQQVQQFQQELAQAQQQVEQERQARKEAEEWRPRLDAAEKELFKLERALELKDGQLAVFMTTAQRQIRGLEDTVKELQKM